MLCIDYPHFKMAASSEEEWLLISIYICYWRPIIKYCFKNTTARLAHVIENHDVTFFIFSLFSSSVHDQDCAGGEDWRWKKLFRKHHSEEEGFQRCQIWLFCDKRVFQGDRRGGRETGSDSGHPWLIRYKTLWHLLEDRDQ